MQRLALLVIVLGLGSGLGFAAQSVPPEPPLPPMPPAPAPAAPVAPTPATPAPVPQASPAAPVPPVPPVPPAPPLPLAGRFKYAPGLLFSPAASQSYFGVHLMEVTEERANELGLKEPYGVEITSVAPGSPAAEAGVLKGDIMIQYRGQRVEGQEQLIRLVRETPVGRRVPVTVRRGVSEVNLTVEIGERKVPQNMVFGCGDEPCEIRIPSIQFRSFDFDIPKPRMVVQSRLLGAELESLEDQLAGYFGVKDGVLVRAVDANSPASRAGLKAGDVIVEVDGTSVRDSSQIREAVRGSSEKAVSLGVMRNRARVALQLEPQVRETALPRPARNFRSGRF